MKISVCIATYNGERYIKEQLDSILDQLEVNDEVVISDDSSTDNTIEIIKSYNDIKIRLFENQKFKSPIYNFENALKQANGDIIILSDQDDIWKPNKIETIKMYMKEYDLVLSDADIIDENGKSLNESFYKLNGSKSGLVKNIVKNSYLGCTMAFNRKILGKSLPFPKDIPMHDWWIGLIAEMYGKTYFIEDRLISYRRHGNNASPTGEKSIYTFKQKIVFRLVIIKNLIWRHFR
ncbi:MAG: glycosyltransferase family 2 protein [Campylobacterota bacterium]|nr:glycosyltransferase family 2 protein [Campylobacterota bacterium]